jgi:hypothetical protein
MRPGISVTVTAADRRRLEAIAGDRNSPQKHVWRAEIVLLSADGLGTVEIMRRAGKSKPASGAGRSASRKKASRAFGATRPVPRASSRSGRR